MAKRRLFKLLSAVVKIKPGEERIALFFFLYFFLITAPFAIVKSIRDASYLEDLGAKSLPYAYATAILVGVAVSLHARLQARLRRRTLILSTLVFFIASSLIFEELFAILDWEWLALVYWFWANLFVVVLTTQFWILVNDIFNPREAKRLIGFFGSGGILGGIGGGLLTGILAKGMSHRLLFLTSGFLLACMIVVQALFAWLKKKNEILDAGASPPDQRKAGAREVGFADCYQAVRQSHYLKLLAASVLVIGIVSTFIDWQSKTVIAGAGKANASFFGFFNSGLMVVAFLFQLILTSRFIERFGLRVGLLVYPLLLLLGSTGLALGPSLLLLAISLKGMDKALSYSIQQSSRELLYIPVMPDVKYKAKIFIDMFINRLAKSVGGGILAILLILPIRQMHNDIILVSIASGLFIGVWIIINLRISRAYVREVKDKLGKKWERADGVVAGAIDLDEVKKVLDALESRKQSPELFALHLYELAKDNKLTPQIRQLLDISTQEASPSAANPLLDGDESPWVPDFEEYLPPAEMNKEIQEILALDSYQQLMNAYAGKVLDDEKASSETAKMELAKAIGWMNGRSPLAARLDEFLYDPSPKVFQYAAESAGRLRKREYVPILALKLADPRSQEDARAALEKYGEAITGALIDYLIDPEESLDIRKGAVSLLARIATPEAARALLQGLAKGLNGLEEDLLDGLDLIRSKQPEMTLDPDLIFGRFDRDIQRLREPRSPADLLPLFKLLGLAYNHEDVFRAYRNFSKGTKDSIAYAVELLDNTVSQDIKHKLLPLLEGFGAPKDQA